MICDVCHGRQLIPPCQNCIGGVASCCDGAVPVTPADVIIQTLRAYRRPIAGYRRGADHPGALFNEAEIRQIRIMHEQGFRPKIIMRRFPQLTYNNFWRIVGRSRWGHVA